MRQPVIKNIPLPINLQNTPVRSPRHIQALPLAASDHAARGFAGPSNAPGAHISVGDNRPPEPESPVRKVADRITQLMVLPGGVDEIIFCPDFAHRRRLKKRMLLEIRPLHAVRDDVARLLPHREHVVLQRQHDRAVDAVRISKDLLRAPPEHLHLVLQPPVREEVRLLLVPVLRPVVEPDHAVVIHNSRVKTYIPPHHLPVLPADLAQVLELPGRLVTDRHADRIVVTALPVLPGHAIVQIIPPVIPPHAVRRIHVRKLSVQRILLRPIDHSLRAPLRQILHRRREDLIILHTKSMPALPVMRPVQVHSPAKNMRLPVRNILIQWQKRVNPLFSSTCGTLHIRAFYIIVPHNNVFLETSLREPFMPLSLQFYYEKRKNNSTIPPAKPASPQNVSGHL